MGFRLLECLEQMPVAFLEHYKDSLYAAVGFVQINETYDIVNDPGI